MLEVNTQKVCSFERCRLFVGLRGLKSMIDVGDQLGSVDPWNDQPEIRHLAMDIHKDRIPFEDTRSSLLS
jgi:hypothetical protein